VTEERRKPGKEEQRGARDKRALAPLRALKLIFWLSRPWKHGLTGSKGFRRALKPSTSLRST